MKAMGYMKIFFTIGSLSGGGAERVVSVLANNFSRKGHEVTIVTLSKNVYTYPLDMGIRRIHISPSIKIKGFSGGQKILKLKKYISLVNPDIVISFTTGINIYVLLTKLLLPFRVIVSERNDPKRDPKNIIYRIARNVLYNLSDGVVFQTPDAQHYFSSRIQSKGVIINNPIKPDLPEPFTGERKKCIVATGRLENQKNYTLLFEAFAVFRQKYPEYTLDIYGEGSLLKQLKQLTVDLKIDKQTTFKGVVANWHQEARDANMYILSSDYEGMPNALMEALAIGLPCIATNCPCGGPRLLIENGVNGLLIPVNDKDALIKCMLNLEEFPDEGESMGNIAAIDMKKFSVNNITVEWETLINKIIKNNK